MKRYGLISWRFLRRLVVWYAQAVAAALYQVEKRIPELIAMGHRHHRAVWDGLRLTQGLDQFGKNESVL